MGLRGVGLLVFRDKGLGVRVRSGASTSSDVLEKQHAIIQKEV